MNPFTEDGTHRAMSDAPRLSVAELLATITPIANPEAGLSLRVATDGYLISICTEPAGDRKIVVTGWTGEGEGRSKGRPEHWRQNYYRAFAEESSAEKRFRDLIAKHGGPAEGADR